MPKASIIIPIYNVEKYLRECLNSVVNQTLEDIEIICVNDGSTDNSLEIINEYAKNDKRIVVINKANSGYGDSMNKGIEAACGEYIGIVEPDDYIEPKMYETLYQAANENGVDFVKTDFYMLYENSTTEHLYLDKTLNKYNRIINPQQDIAPYFFSPVLGTWSGIYKKEFLDKNNIRYNKTPGARYQDQGFWWQTLLAAQKVLYLDKPFYYYRQTSSNSSNNPKGFYWIIKEFGFIENFLLSNALISEKKELVKIFHTFKFQHYLWNFSKLPKKEKNKNFEILYREFATDNSKNNIDKNILNTHEKEQYDLLIERPKKFREQFYTPFIQRIFSVKNQGNYKVLRLFGVKFKFKQKILVLQNDCKMLQDEINKIAISLQEQIAKQEEYIDSASAAIINLNIKANALMNNSFVSFDKILALPIKPYNRCYLDTKISYINNLFSNLKGTFDNTAALETEPNFFYTCGIRPNRENSQIVLNALIYGKPTYIIEDCFLRSIFSVAYKNIEPKYQKSIGFTIDDITSYYDANFPSRLELLLNDKNLIISDEQKLRAKKCIDKLVVTHLSKYNNQPIFEPKIGRDGVKKVLVVDQSFGDMSITRGWGSEKIFEDMLQSAIKENPNADIIVKTHPDTISKSRGGYYTGLKAHDNIYLQTEPINPISLIKYVDKVYVCTTQFGFEALMCGKEVHVFGMPFYAGWGLTNDRQKCERRTNTRTLEEIFYIAYIMYSYYVNPDKKCRCEIEEAMDYLLKLRDEYFKKEEENDKRSICIR